MDELMPESDNSFFIVASSSMMPFLKPGDRIVTEPVRNIEIKPGVVIVFKSTDGKKIVHRVVKKSGYLVQTAGDSNRRLDKPIHIYDILGKVKGLDVIEPLSKLERKLRAVRRLISKWL